MKSVKLDYGDSHMEVGLPDSATIVRYKETYDDPPEKLADALIQRAIRPASEKS